jgi:Lectin C-type domain
MGDSGLRTSGKLLGFALCVAGCGRIGFDPADASAPEFHCDAASLVCPADGVAVEHAGRAYVWLPALRTYAEADAACVALGGRVARIDDQAEHDFAWALARPEVMWIAGDDSGEEGVGQWPNDGTIFWHGLADGVPTAGVYANWGLGEPNNTRDEDCLTLWPEHDGAWADEPCSRRYKTLCESGL